MFASLVYVFEDELKFKRKRKKLLDLCNSIGHYIYVL